MSRITHHASRAIAAGIGYSPLPIRSRNSSKIFLFSRTFDRSNASFPRFQRYFSQRRRQQQQNQQDYYTSPPMSKATKLTKRLFIWPFIAVNGLVFFWWQMARNDADRHRRFGRWKYMNENFVLSRKNVREGRWYTELTAAISHESLSHFIFNMVSFNSFAATAIYAGVRLPSLLVLSIGSALACSTASLYQRGIPRRKERGSLGASGIVMGFGVTVACLRPFSKFAFMLIPVPIPAWAMMLAYAGIDMYLIDSETSRVGHAGHLGGATFGALYYVVRLRRLGGVWDLTRGYLRGRR